MIGTIRVGNKRSDAPNYFKQDFNEEPVNIDRGNSVLANPYKICASLSRKQCLALYRADFEKDMRAKGPMFQECQRIAALMAQGKDVVLLCWCKPAACHGDIIAEQIMEMVSVEA